MNTTRLSLIVAVLLTCVGLAATNPTMDDYLKFVEARLSHALEQMDQTAPTREKEAIRTFFRAQGKRLIQGLVRPSTKRANWGFWSMFRTQFMETEVVVLGVGGQLIPIRGVEEATGKIGRLAF
ncbi:MAG: DUF4359 domain-containing protein [Nitrospiraceae bacterium]